MHSTETMRSMAVHLRKLSEDAEEELAAQLLNLAAEYDRMAGRARDSSFSRAPRCSSLR